MIKKIIDVLIFHLRTIVLFEFDISRYKHKINVKNALEKRVNLEELHTAEKCKQQTSQKFVPNHKDKLVINSHQN